MFYSNYDSISCRFWDIQCRKISRPWNLSQVSIKVIESGSIRYIGYSFLLVFYSNFVTKTQRLWDIRLQKHRNLDNRVRSPSQSLKISPFDRAHKSSYLRSIATKGLSRTISEISADFSRKLYKKIPTPIVFCTPAERVPLELDIGAGSQKTRRWLLFLFNYFSAVLTKACAMCTEHHAPCWICVSIWQQSIAFFDELQKLINNFN